MASPDLKNVLDTFYEKLGRPPLATHKYLYKLRSVAEKIFEMVKKRDSRFSGEIADAGSLISHVGAMNIDECDMLLLLDIAGQWEEDQLYPNYARFRLADKRWKDCATENGFLLPRKVADLFYKYVAEILRTVKFEGIKPNVTGEGTVATTLSAHLTEFEGMLGSLTMDIDLVVAVKCRGWPTQANAAWLQDGSGSRWLGQENLQHIKGEGFQLVAKSYFGGDDSTKSLWRLSFALAEVYLLDRIQGVASKTVFSPCYKKLLVILKTIRKLAFSEPKTTPLLSSYHLKTLLYHQAYRYPNPKDWGEDKLGERFLTAIQELCHNTEKKLMPHFFIPSVNLFSRGSIMTSKVKFLRDRPYAFLEELLKTSHRPSW